MPIGAVQHQNYTALSAEIATSRTDETLLTAEETEGTDVERSAAKPTSRRDEERDLQREMEDGEQEEKEIRERLRIIDHLRNSRAEPLERRLRLLAERRTTAMLRLEELHTYREEGLEIPPGPPSMRWVEANWFHALCMGVILLNMAEMFEAVRKSLGPLEAFSGALDASFLVWYCFELIVRATYHQKNFLIGRPTVVCWNYMDLLIVMSGSLELIMSHVSGSTRSSHLSALRMLRLLRLFRVMRVLKLLKFFFESDLSWIEGPKFESFIGFVIGVNALVMWLELDYRWDGWKWLEHAFLVIYTFEVAVKAKVSGSGFFVSEVNRQGTGGFAPQKEQTVNLWNIMDLLIVVSGIMDLWMIPLYGLFFLLLTGEPFQHESGGAIVIFRMLRLVRIFRLVRLIRNIKPLYNLLVGVTESMAAMFWVFVLALVVLYALAIVFTSFVGKGFLWPGGEGPDEAMAAFGSVPQSMYMLFKLMNDDQSTVESIVTTAGGRGLFVLAMVVSNWALLAILTSVMSDNMIGVSTRTQAEDEKELTRQLEEKSTKQLMFLFEEIDTDQSGLINEKEWRAMMRNPDRSGEIASAAGVTVEELESFFSCLCENAQNKEGRHSEARLVMSYLELIEALKERGSLADKRSQLHILKRLKSMDRRLETRLEILLDAMATINDDASKCVEDAFRGKGVRHFFGEGDGF
mmetsp:Transcript_41948/g.78026  ORF Transcript_41948/g.78026 Transcript_41948/m.78026 type:complete len:691 (+) Transcript_41948:61-2133(+)